MTYFCRVVAVLLLVLLGLSDAQAQFATVRGRIVDADTELPMPGVNVLLEGDRRLGTATDTEGLFILSRLTPGQYILTASFIGYEAFTDTLTLTFDEALFLTVRLTSDTALLEEVLVETNRSDQERFAGMETVTPSSLTRVPMPDVTYDLAGYLLTLPGFVSPGDQGGQLFVRGGTPTQNLVLLDGMPLYQPFHIISFYSAFPADLVSYADIYAGGFGAKYGGRISSVLDVSMRNGNKQRAVGAVSVAPFLSTVRLEVPLSKNKVSLIASVRESIIELVAPGLMGREMPFRFGDRFLKFHAFLNQTSSFSATYLNTFDEGNIGATEATDFRRSNWKNEAFGARYTYLPNNFAVMTQWSAFVSRMENRYSPTPDQERRSAAESINVNLIFAYLLGTTQLNFGLKVSLHNFDFDLGGRQGKTKSRVSNGSFHFDTRFHAGKKIRLEPGFRIEAFSNGISTAFDPRLRLLWLPHGSQSKQQITAAWGIYHQQIIGLNNEQDLANVFTVWTTSPRNTPVPASMHFILGWQRLLQPWLEFSTEAFYKDLTNITFPVFADVLNEVEAFTRMDGTAMGIDFRLKLNRRAIYSDVSYTLSAVEYQLADKQPVAIGFTSDVSFNQFYPPHDRRHQVNALVQFAHGPYRLSLRWQYGSGLPFTQVNGYYEGLDLTDPDSDDFHTQTGPTFVSRADLYQARLPAYHRLDLSGERTFDFNNIRMTLQAGLINAYNRENILEYNAFTGTRTNQLPLIPSLGIKVEVL